MRVSMRWKLVGTYFILIALTVLLANWMSYNALREYYLQERQDAYRIHTTIISTHAGEYIARGNLAMPAEIREYGQQVNARVLFIDRNGLVVGDSFNEDWILGRQLEHLEVQAALRGETASGTHFISPEEWVMYVAAPVTSQKEVVGAVLLSTEITDITQALEAVIKRMVMLSFLGAMLAGLIGLWLSAEITRPVQQLTRAVERVALGNFNQRVKVRSRDELGQLAKSFNTMARKLARVDQNRREFIANASHELKSPLASIKALAESLVYSDERDVEVYKEYLRDIDTEVDRLNRMVHDLLKLAQLEDERIVLHREEQSVQKIIARVVHLVTPQAISKGIDLSVTTQGDLIWPVDKDVLSGILLNLVDNGIKYTLAGDRVEVVGRIEEEKLVLEVRDTGDGIPPDDLPHIFERFYRVDKARSRDTGGTGLGLAIVEQGVRLMGGTIKVVSQPELGTTFTIKLPKKS